MGCLRLEPTDEKSTVLRCIWRRGNSTKSGVDRYDYGARFYDPQIGRTMTPDPHAESYLHISPYSFLANNPLIYTDPTGMDVEYIHDDDGNVIGYRITGDDIYTYHSSLQDVSEGNTPIENVMEALDYAAASNDGAGGPLANTIETVQVVGNMPESLPLLSKQDFRGSNGLIKYILNVVDGWQYDFEGNPRWPAPIAGDAPTPGKTYRSVAQKAKYLKELYKSGRAPAWMKPWLKRGKVPPGHQVDHVKALSDGGKDIPSNMGLKTTSDHRIRHKFYRPWQKKN